MRTTLVLFTLALLPLAAFPTANAAHQGACWHEYAEGAVWALGQSSPLKAYSPVVSNCNARAVGQVCYIVSGNRDCVAS